jgi:ribulose-5-phosphate 4-epimerase/fuculose-1-phosphate aldolase
MTVHTLRNSKSLRQSVSAAEWEARLELAAAYRLMDHLGITDMAHNHITVRVPDEPDAFLIKPSDAFFNEVTASTVEKYDFKGEPRQEGLGRIKGAGVFHAAILAARSDVNATIHSHSPANIGVSCQKHGLLPISQHALHFQGMVGYHEYGGFEADPTLIPMIVRDLAKNDVAFLRNHGALVVGPTLGYAFVSHFQLEMACRAQVAALSAGYDQVVQVAPKAIDYTVTQLHKARERHATGGKDWKGWLRQADRLFPDYQD